MNNIPSEHAMRARIAYNTQAGDLPRSLEEIIDTYAIAPAVAERDKRIEELEVTIRKMLVADTEAGCGFYDDEEWRKYYLMLQSLVKYYGRTSVFDPSDNYYSVKFTPWN